MPSRSSSRQPGRWRRRLFFRLLPLLLTLVASHAHAQRSPSCQADSQCWRELSRGSKLAEAADYPAALVAFQQAFARIPDPRLQINIGRSLHRLGRYDEAIAAFQRYQATAPASSPPEEQEIAQRFLTESQAAQQKSTPAPSQQPATQASPIYKKWSSKKSWSSDGTGCWNEGTGAAGQIGGSRSCGIANS